MTSKATLRALIETAGLTQRQAAEALGVSRRMLQYWMAEGSEYDPPRMALDALRLKAGGCYECPACGRPAFELMPESETSVN